MERQFIETDKERLQGKRASELKNIHTEMGGQTFHMGERREKRQCGCIEGTSGLTDDHRE